MTEPGAEGVETVLRDLASAAACYLQCAHVAYGEDRRMCEDHLATAVHRARDVLDLSGADDAPESSRIGPEGAP